MKEDCSRGLLPQTPEPEGQMPLLFTHSVVSNSSQPHELQPAKLLCPWDFPGKNTGVGCHFLLQGNFLTQGVNLHLLHQQEILFNTEAPGKPQNAYSHSHTHTHTHTHTQVLCMHLENSPAHQSCCECVRISRSHSYNAGLCLI